MICNLTNVVYFSVYKKHLFFSEMGPVCDKILALTLNLSLLIICTIMVNIFVVRNMFLAQPRNKADEVIFTLQSFIFVTVPR